MAEPEHVLRAILTVYVANEEKYVQGTGALTALLARLTTAEQECETLREVELELRARAIGAEARVEAADVQLLAVLAAFYDIDPVVVAELCDTRIDPSGALLGKVRDAVRSARAALACPPQGAGPGCKNHRGDPHNLCEACWALEPPAGCPPPESSRDVDV